MFFKIIVSEFMYVGFSIVKLCELVIHFILVFKNIIREKTCVFLEISPSAKQCTYISTRQDCNGLITLIRSMLSNYNNNINNNNIIIIIIIITYGTDHAVFLPWDSGWIIDA